MKKLAQFNQEIKAIAPGLLKLQKDALDECQQRQAWLKTNLSSSHIRNRRTTAVKAIEPSLDNAGIMFQQLVSMLTKPGTAHLIGKNNWLANAAYDLYRRNELKGMEEGVLNAILAASRNLIHTGMVKFSNDWADKLAPQQAEMFLKHLAPDELEKIIVNEQEMQRELSELDQTVEKLEQFKLVA